MTNNYIPEVKSIVIKIVSLSKPYFVGADSNNFDTYENDNYGYIVLYPVNWIQRDLDGTEKNVFFISDPSGKAIIGISAIFFAMCKY
jgi:hypothetical protein